MKIVEDFDIVTGKTKDLVKILKNLVPDERTVLILADEAPLVKRAGANIPWLNFLSFQRLCVHDMFYGKNLLMLETAAKRINELYGSKGE